ncbi:methylmalonyl-CoA mutase family protein [Glycocaulis abyssi]|uniref:Methylmalonyl-CoA mutase family protein n=1 Tax=Glycocaulis abyssi TaxID=1433403 RepID=A0ABV9NA17_9PROT
MTDQITPLADGFAPATPDAWEVLAQKALAGKSIDTLVRRTRDDIARGPLYASHNAAQLNSALPGTTPFTRGRILARDTYLPWAMRQAHDTPAPRDANTAILADLAGGASEITLLIDPAGKSGIAARHADELEATLADVMLDLAPVHLRAGPWDIEAADLLLAVLKTRDSVAGAGLGLSAALGQEAGKRIALAARAREISPAIRAFRADGRAVFEAGGTEVQELAFAAASAAEAIEALVNSGWEAGNAAATIELELAADTDIHLTIAKLRAMRLIWAQMMDAWGVSDDRAALYLHATTAERGLSAIDPWTNLIRAACAGFAATAGGADALTITPMTRASGRSTPFSRRLARNLHILLAEESHAGKVNDPAGGSYLHETLSHRLAEAAWSEMQRIIGLGGASAAMRSDAWKADIAKAADSLMKLVSTGKEPVIGVTAYPDLDPRVLKADDAAYSPPSVSGSAFGDQPVDSVPLPAPMRTAEPFEQVRVKVEAAAPGPVFLATLGTLPEFNARAGFAINRLGVAGLRATPAMAHDSAQACVDAFKDSGSPLAIICGSDEAYGDHAAELASALKAAGANAVWLAGRRDSASADAAIDHAIHMRSDALEDARLAARAMGVTP